MSPQQTITQDRQALGVFFAIVILISLSACATRQQSYTGPMLSWSERQQQLASIQSWSFNGRLAIKDQQDESWNASVKWRQQGNSYDIRLSGAFGQGAARMSGHDGFAEIETTEQSAITASSAEELMQQQLGWFVPVAGLKHWLLGALGPELTEWHEADALGRLALLRQDGWEVRYQSFMLVDGVELPRKLELENPNLRARLVIDSWHLTPEVRG